MAPIHKKALGAYTSIYYITYDIDIDIICIYIYMLKISSRNKKNTF